ncbi:outer membrane beta-barrel family protein [Segetibacter aerophilus]|uniref:TonB-dependent receptor n=1 Tax=Segetibacter aerophilus TaxID=670293 RepID=A0A512BGK0_9BACT|nr:outer membrane beta-barrel family protein [Segetibacter aerophilus]GEO11086.1 TonB-dependent receptor [Segetibacter aerophilus]
MIRLLVILATTLLCTAGAAQKSAITGKVADEKGNPIAFVNVTMLPVQKNAASVGAALTDSFGMFSLSTPTVGRWRLQFTVIGFTKKDTTTATDSLGTPVQLGTITLQPEWKQLENVDVLAIRPTITQLPDRLVITVQGTAMAAGNNAFGVLSKAPGVFVDPEGAIQLNGRGGVTVMIDGRLTYLSARDLRNLLESTPAENIKSIEIISNPSSKYDAEGTSGIINIVFKKNVLQGTNGTVNVTYGTNLKQNFYGAGLTLNHKSSRFNSFLVSDFNRRGSGREATFTRVFRNNNTSTYFDQTAVGSWANIGPPSLRIGSDFTINEKHSVGFIASYFTNTAKAEFLTETFIGPEPKKPAQFIDADNYNSNTLKNAIANIHYSGKLDTLGSTLSADVDFARVSNKGDGNFYNSFTRLSDGQKTTDNLYTLTPNGFDIFSGKIDFSYVLNKNHKAEMGGRVSQVDSDNDFRFYFNNNGKVIDPQRTNYFKYKESIYAGYVNWTGTLTKKTSVQLGLRTEQTVSRGHSLTTGEITDRKYLDFFPSVFLQHKASESYNVTANYSRRLNRPNYSNLNPFRSYRDPYTWTVGNPSLRPQYTDLFNVTQTFKKLYILQLFYQYTKDVMIELPMADPVNSVTVYTTGNVDDSYSTGVSAIIPVKLAKKWDTRNTAQVSYSKYSTVQNNEPVLNEQLFYYIQSAHTILLPKDFRTEATFLYRGPAAAGLYHQQAMYRIDLAFSKSLWKKKIEVAVNINDLTKGWRFRWAANYGGNVNEFDQYLRWRTFGISLRYKFSKGQKAELRQRSGPDELNRL